MKVLSSLYFALFITISSSVSVNQAKTSKEWIYHFDAANDKNWDNYEIASDSATLKGEASGCTVRFPVIFKKLCVDWNHNDGFSFDFKAVNNRNQNYNDLLWFYGDRETAKNAHESAQFREKTAENPTRRRLIIDNNVQCYLYNDARACAHIHPSNENLMTLSVGINDDDHFGADYDEYGDYDDEYDDSDDFDAAYDEDSDYDDEYDEDVDLGGKYDEYDEYYHGYDDYDDYDDDEDYYDDYLDDNGYYDENEIYSQYMQQQALYNQQWANYMNNLNNLYWQNMLQQQQYMANVYGGEGADGFGAVESNVMRRAEAAAQKHVEADLEKKLEAKFEGKLEKDMMSKMGQEFGGSVHRKRGDGERFDDEDGNEDRDNRDGFEQHHQEYMPPPGLIDVNA